MLYLFFGACSATLAFYLLCKNENEINLLSGWMIAILAGILMTASLLQTKNADTTYYQEAEVVAYNDTSVYFGTENNNIFYLTTCGLNYPDTVPYLLHMDSMGTDDISDDKILIAWRCIE